MDWQYKLSSLTKETECNLESMKNQLYTRPSDISSLLVGSGTSKTPEHKLNYIPLDQSPGIIVLLEERLDEQARAIADLTTAVKSLQEERDASRRIVRELQDEMQGIKCHLRQSGISLHDDRKLEQWRHDVASDMQGLHNQLQLYHTRNSDSSALALNNELHSSRRLMYEECEAFRQELTTVKSSLMRFELHMASIDGDTKELQRAQERLNKTVKNIMDVQELTRQDLNHTKKTVSKEMAQLQHLQNCYQKLRDKLSAIQVCQASSGMSEAQIKTTHRQRAESALNDFNSRARTESEAHRTSWVWQHSQHNTLPLKSNLDFGLTDSETGCEEKKLNILLPPHEEYSQRKTLSSDEDDYLLSDLNLSSDDLLSSDEEFDLNDVG